MIRTYRYRLYPTKAQARTLDFLLWQGRTLYNAALEQRITVYKETGKGVSYYQQWAYFRDLRNANPDTLGQLNATSVQQMLRRLDKAFAAFFRAMLNRGVNLAPSKFEAWFLTTAHTEADIDFTLEAAEAAFKEIAKR